MEARHAGTGSHRLVAGAQVARRAALAVVGLATLAFAAPAAATTETFNFTGAAQTWTVPAGVTSATFDLYGAQGGGFAIPTFAPGLGGRATATIAVTPGASIQVNVGGQGASGVEASTAAATAPGTPGRRRRLRHPDRRHGPLRPRARRGRRRSGWGRFLWARGIGR